MVLTSQQIRERIISIERHIDRNSKYYGNLLKWEDSRNNNWHYGIGLSDTHIFDTGKSLKVLKRYNVDAMYVYGIDPFNPDETIERLKYALRCFASKPFDPITWNAEHLALLVVTNRPGIRNIELNKLTQKKFENYLKEYEPRLNKKLPGIIVDARTWVYFFFVSLALLIALILNRIQGINSVVIFILILISLPIFAALMIQISRFNWSGFQEKRLWNWLELLIVPLWLALGAFYLNYTFQQRQEKENRARIEQQDKANQERIEQDALKAYLAQMKDILIGKDAQNSTRLSENAKPVAEALTLTVLNEISGTRKGQVIRFLKRVGLIECSNTTQDCKTDISLEYANLVGADLTNANLRYVNFKKANLTNAKLDNTDLTNADFRGANLTNVSFSAANLKNSKFDKATTKNKNLELIIALRDEKELELLFKKKGDKFNLSSKDFRRFNLQNTDLRKTILSGVNLESANLEASNLEGVNLENANLSQANLFAANLNSTNMTGINLSGADLNSADLNRANLTSAQLIGANLIGTRLETANLKNSDLQGACYSQGTRFPKNFNPQGKGLKLIEPPNQCN